jgi:hypothetical protein
MTPQSVALAVVFGPIAFYVCVDQLMGVFLAVRGGGRRRR